MLKVPINSNLVKVKYDESGVVERAIMELQRKKNEFFPKSDDSELVRDSAGVWVGMRLTTPGQVFESLRRTVFQGFEPHCVQQENGRLWAGFGYRYTE